MKPSDGLVVVFSGIKIFYSFMRLLKQFKSDDEIMDAVELFTQSIQKAPCSATPKSIYLNPPSDKEKAQGSKIVAKNSLPSS